MFDAESANTRTDAFAAAIGAEWVHGNQLYAARQAGGRHVCRDDLSKDQREELAALPVWRQERGRWITRHFNGYQETLFWPASAPTGQGEGE